MKGGARRRAIHDQTACFFKERVAGGRFNLTPEFVRPQGEGNVFFAFAYGLPCDAAVAMRRTHGVWRAELIDAENATALLRELIDGGASHRAQAENNDV